MVPGLAGGFIVLMRGEEVFFGFNLSFSSAFEAAVILNTSYYWDFLTQLMFNLTALM